MNKQFYRTEVKVIVLTSKPLEFDSLKDLNYLITEGDAIGDYVSVKSKIINNTAAKTMAKKLNSSPEFLECI